ncbi:MAG: hypothetical protein HYW93_06415, partial [Thaumarchaeota archaeon]|nr:hypothetical protein [Nitrososphaerota archaeon]
LQLMLFYANATAYSCPFRVGGKITFDLRNVRRDAALSSSAAVPLWSEDVSEVSPESSEIDLELEHSVERIPNGLMTLGELYLATKSIERAKILFLDRPLSGTYSTLSRDVRLLLKRGQSNLTKLSFVGKKVSMLDLRLALNLGSPGMGLPTRRRYLAHRVIRSLMTGPASIGDLSRRLSAGEAEIGRAVKRIQSFDREHDGELLSSSSSNLALREGVSGYWERVTNLAESHARRVFEEGSHPLNVSGNEWLSVLDLNTLCFITLERVCELVKKEKVLLIGIAKDTTATDINRAVLPLATKEGIVTPEKSAPNLKNDRAFLTLLSAMNETLKTPWRTIGYDAALSTIIASPDGLAFNSARKYVSREQLFVRGFFQIRTLGDRGKIRSRVFLFDRLFDEVEDSRSVSKVDVKETGGLTEVAPYLEAGNTSRVSNMVLQILSLNDNPEVFEAFGHNQLLYLADKAVKAEMRLMRGSLRAVADLRLGALSRREKIYGAASTYRDDRSEMEEARRVASRG